MKILAVGDREMLVGFWLSGVKQTLETEDEFAALQFIQEMEKNEKTCLIVIQSRIYREIEERLGEIRERKPSFIFHEFSGSGLNWNKKK